MNLYDFFRVVKIDGRKPTREPMDFVIDTGDQAKLNLAPEDLIEVMFRYFSEPSSPSNIDDYEVSQFPMEMINANLPEPVNGIDIVTDLSRVIGKIDFDRKDKKIKLELQ